MIKLLLELIQQEINVEIVAVVVFGQLFLVSHVYRLLYTTAIFVLLLPFSLHLIELLAVFTEDLFRLLENHIENIFKAELKEGIFIPL